MVFSRFSRRVCQRALRNGGSVVFCLNFKYTIDTMAISIAEVEKIAGLARLALTEAEKRRYAETISAVLDYMKILNEVDTDGVEPTYQVTGLQNVMRQDKAIDCDIGDKLIAQMPEVEKQELAVPAVFE